MPKLTKHAKDRLEQRFGIGKDERNRIAPMFNNKYKLVEIDPVTGEEHREVIYNGRSIHGVIADDKIVTCYEKDVHPSIEADAFTRMHNQLEEYRSKIQSLESQVKKKEQSVKAVATERTMTIKEVASALGVDLSTVQKKAKSIFPELVRNGRATLLNEVQVTIIKKAIFDQNPNLGRVSEVKTDLEKELIIQQALMIQKDRINELELKNRDLIIKADVADAIANAEGLILPSNAGKQISGHPNLFIKWLEEEKIVYRRKEGGKILPNARLHDRGYMELKTLEVDGDAWEQTYFTTKGLAWICAKYRMDHNLLNFPVEA